jgi:hypothetical protein
LEETLLVDDGQAFFADGRRVIALVAESETFKPVLDIIGVLDGLLLLEDSLDYTVSITGKVLDRKNQCWSLEEIDSIKDLPSRQSP